MALFYICLHHQDHKLNDNDCKTVDKTVITNKIHQHEEYPAHFEKFISEIETGDGEVFYKEIDARDVTDEFNDLETRLQNKRNYLQRYSE